jgi:hypothetical protein
MKLSLVYSATCHHPTVFAGMFAKRTQADLA